eukprot:TRINITY_DN9496_c0_g1_i2.p1 TRINITY_DN9496_c0_g1~~TRINITY_DN9496_c0_g1_i2.p1  ORF type:complete len:319 (+),score=35.39 TRINITY_DN9496_c0_g1_i2:375-1331(+)
MAHPPANNNNPTLRWANSHKEAILLVQEVLTCHRPKWFAGVVGGCHVAWYFFFIAERPILAKISLLSLGVIIGNALLKLLRERGLLANAMPSPLPARQNTDFRPLRTLPELCDLYDTCKRDYRSFIDSCRSLHERSPGQMTFWGCVFCLAMIGLFETVSTAIVAYVGMWSLLLLPIFERHTPTRRVASRAYPYLAGPMGKLTGLINKAFEHLPEQIIHVADDPDSVPRQPEFKLNQQDSTLADEDLLSPQPPADSRQRGWSMLHDDSQISTDNHPESLSETRRRGWSVLHDDDGINATGPQLRASETEEGFQNISFES